MFGNENEESNRQVLGDLTWNRPSIEFDPVNGDSNEENHPNQDFQNFLDLMHVPLMVLFTAIVAGISLGLCYLARQIWIRDPQQLTPEESGSLTGRRKTSEKSLPSYESLVPNNIEEDEDQLPSYEEAKRLREK